MKCITVFILIFVLKNTFSNESAGATLGLHDRIALLKRKIEQEIKDSQRSQSLTPIVEKNDFVDNYEYVDNENQPITPIMDFDERKKRDRFKLRQLKKSADNLDVLSKEGPSNRKPKEVREKDEKPLRSKKDMKTVKKGKRTHSKPIDIFYRRQIDDEMRNVPLEWTHCHDLITPYFSGYKANISVAKRLTVKDHVVLRLVQLLSINTTDYSKDDIYSVMYQISNLQLRLFQWDIGSMKVLLNIVIKDKIHSFYTLKHGIKDIFKNWHLDITNTTNLLKQARIFRPPCIRMSDYEGSTKTSRSIRYTKSVKEKKRCSLYDDDGECWD